MRTFVAVEISNQTIIDEIVRIQNELKNPSEACWKLKNVHFTLQFLGEISESTGKDVQKTLESIDFEPFELSFRGIGAFPKPKFPRVVWIGTDSAGGEKLKELAKKVESALFPLGFKNDKPFKTSCKLSLELKAR